MAPPLRTEADRKALVDALRAGIIDCIATDHAPHSIEDKDVEFSHAANGVIGLETAYAVCMKLVEKGDLTHERLVESLTASPARIFKFFDRGQLTAGYLADFAIVDPNLKWNITKKSIYSKSYNSPFMGWDVKGRVTSTVVGGVEVYSLERGILV
jgi:dihydroorotase